MQWRKAEDLPAAPELISLPYDPEARYSKKRQTEWTGYKVHLTETCDAGLPNILTDVTTTPATTSDVSVLPEIQSQLAAQSLVPAEQIVDAGYISSDHLLTSRSTHAIDLIGPVAPDPSWRGLWSGTVCDGLGGSAGDLSRRQAERDMAGASGSAWSCNCADQIREVGLPGMSDAGEVYTVSDTGTLAACSRARSL
jgi:hypothetical protein